MMPAPLVAKCVTKPPAIRRIIVEERPFLMECAPKASTTGAPRVFASLISAAAAATSASASSDSSPG
jgi:hypothetical protein